jgi:hypothetical protein
MRLQSHSGRSGVEKNSQPLSGLEPPIMQLVAQRYITELSWLLSNVKAKQYFNTVVGTTRLLDLCMLEDVPISDKRY